MAAQMLDGRALSAQMMAALAPTIQGLQLQLGRPVGLGVILVGDDGPSAVYVRNKERAARRAGIASRVVRLPATCTQEALMAAIASCNADPAIDAFLLQLPIPKHLSAREALGAIDPRKDADGLHPLNVAALVGGAPTLRPCTPAGCMHLIAQALPSVVGCHAVVVGRSAIVGRPMAQMLLDADATVTLCHQATRDLASHTRMADVLVVAVGQPGLLGHGHIRPGAVVIDVGINRVADGAGGTCLVGDVDPATGQELARAITPVPGGVGPMTITMLLHNAVQAAQACALGSVAPR